MSDFRKGQVEKQGQNCKMLNSHGFEGEFLLFVLEW